MGAMLGGQAGNFALGGLFVGMLLGFCFGVPFLHALEEFGKSLGNLRGDRTSELLVKYHDVLVELARSENGEAGSSADDGGGGTKKDNV